MVWCEPLWICIRGTCVPLCGCSSPPGLAGLAEAALDGAIEVLGVAGRLLTWCKIDSFFTWSGQGVLIRALSASSRRWQLLSVALWGCFSGRCSWEGGGTTAVIFHFCRQIYLAAKCVRVGFVSLFVLTGK